MLADEVLDDRIFGCSGRLCLGRSVAFVPIMTAILVTGAALLSPFSCRSWSFSSAFGNAAAGIIKQTENKWHYLYSRFLFSFSLGAPFDPGSLWRCGNGYYSCCWYQ